jgi:hypothetical protein
MAARRKEAVSYTIFVIFSAYAESSAADLMSPAICATAAVNSSSVDFLRRAMKTGRRDAGTCEKGEGVGVGECVSVCECVQVCVKMCEYG